jgi:hypothetical protein
MQHVSLLSTPIPYFTKPESAYTFSMTNRILLVFSPRSKPIDRMDHAAMSPRSWLQDTPGCGLRKRFL